MNLYGGVEAGGTKFACGVGSGKGELLVYETFPTTTPEETLENVCKFFNKNKVEAIGVGSFGPLNLNSKSPDYGSILNTVKPGWQSINIPRQLNERLQIKTAIVTDTDSAAIGEQFFGKGVGLINIVYITIGTAIGGTVIINNDIVHGISHPEMGHIIIPSDNNLFNEDSAGGCSYHKNCLEGLASGKSIELRYGKSAGEITNEAFWLMEAKLIAYGLVNVISFIQPQKIIIGGGVAKKSGFINNVQQSVLSTINGYFELPNIEEYIVHASSDTIGVLGSIKLAQSLHD